MGKVRDNMDDVTHALWEIDDRKDEVNDAIRDLDKAIEAKKAET